MPQSNLLDESIDTAACHVTCCVLAPVPVFLCPTGDFLRGPHELNEGINWRGSAAFRDEEALICMLHITELPYAHTDWGCDAE